MPYPCLPTHFRFLDSEYYYAKTIRCRFFVGYRTIIARYVAKGGIAQMCNPEGPAIEKIQSRSKISIPARNFQSRSKISISIENFNPPVSIYGALVVYKEGLDRKFQSTIDRSKFSIPKAAIEFFQSPGPLGRGCVSHQFGVLLTSLKKYLAIWAT